MQNTAASLNATRSLLSASGALARCFTHNIVPAGNQRISDPPITTGLQVYQEFFQSAVGLAGAAGNFDGNGRFLRAVAGGGPYQQETPAIPSNGPEYGNFVTPALGTRPAFAGSPPPLRRDVPCDRNAVPNLNSATHREWRREAGDRECTSGTSPRSSPCCSRRSPRWPTSSSTSRRSRSGTATTRSRRSSRPAPR